MKQPFNHRPAKFWPLVGFATLAGMRSQSAPAFLTYLLTHRPTPNLAGSPLRFMQKPLVATTWKLIAAGELVADKLPGVPNRTAPPILLGRLLSGALVGAAWYKSQHGSAWSGAALGAAIAGAATFASFALRMGVSRAAGLPVALVGVGEDALVLAGGAALLRTQKPPQGRAL